MTRLPRDPQAFWTVTAGTNDIVRLTSSMPGNFDLDFTLTAPADIGIATRNFTLTPITAGSFRTDGQVEGGLTAALPYFRVTSPAATGQRAAAFFQPVGMDTQTTTGEIMTNIMQQAIMTYTNWEIDNTTGNVVTMRSSDDLMARDIPATLRVGERPVTGTWRVEVVAPGNTINTGIEIPTALSATSTSVTAGAFSLRCTPSYMGVLVSNPTVPEGFEFLVLEAGDPDSVVASAAVAAWVTGIRAGLPRISLVTRDNGFFLQPANYDSLANFVLDVFINDTPQNADRMYQLATTGIDPMNPTRRAVLNAGSNLPLFVNGSEADDVLPAPETLPLSTSPEYLRAGGPLKVASRLQAGVNTLANLSITGTTTLIFDIFRPWPRDEINRNLEYPILATVNLLQDSGGIFRRINKITGADIGWSRPTYTFPARRTTEDLTNFREMVVTGTDDFPQDYESYYERAQLALLPEFDTEQLTSLALWGEGATPEFLRGSLQRNQLDVRVETTNNPGEFVNLSSRNTMSLQNANANLFNIAGDYKVDLRLHGRFVNYRVTDGQTLDTTVENASHQAEWSVSGMQADIMKGGTR